MIQFDTTDTLVLQFEMEKKCYILIHITLCYYVVLMNPFNIFFSRTKTWWLDWSRWLWSWNGNIMYWLSATKQWWDVCCHISLTLLQQKCRIWKCLYILFISWLRSHMVCCLYFSFLSGLFFFFVLERYYSVFP